jgi:DNA-binding transcriptional LysR family regulator
MEELLRERPRFDPATQQHTFRIATTDYFEQTVLPLFFQHLEKSAPQITVVSRPTRGELPRKELETGEFDLAIAGFYKDIPESFYQQRLFRDDFVGVTRKNLLKRKELTIAKYASLSHLVVSPQGDLKTMASQQMKKHGYDLQYRAGVSNFLSPARMLIHTDMILTCPRKLALSFIEMGHHDLLELPIEIPSISVIQVWHERNKSSEAHIWLRNAMKSVCDSLTGR